MIPASNDIRIRTSQWTIRPDADTAEVEAAILGLEDSTTVRVGRPSNF